MNSVYSTTLVPLLRMAILTKYADNIHMNNNDNYYDYMNNHDGNYPEGNLTIRCPR